MDQLDQFFKDKFQDRKFEFKDAYWEETQKLIEEDRRRRRRKMIWYWSGGLLLVLALSLGAYYFLSTSNDTNLVATENTSITTTESTDKQQNKSNQKNNSANSTNANQGETPANATLESKSTSNAEKTTADTGAKATTPASPEASATGANTKQEPSETLASNANPSQPNTQKNNTTSGANPPTTKANNKQQTNATTPKTQQLQNSLTKNLNPSTTNPSTTQQLKNSTTKKLNPSTTTPSTSFQKLNIQYPTFKNPPPEPLAQKPTALPAPSPWRLGLSLQTAIYPAKAGENWWAGASIGASLRYRLAPSWAIQSDWRYFQGRGQFGSLEEVSQRSYSFGLQEKNFQLSPSALHYIEWPVYLQLKNGRQYIETGIAVNYLMGTRGELVEHTFLLPWERGIRGGDPNEKVESKIIEKGWLEQDAFRRVNMDLMLGYRYQLSTQAELSLQMHYALSSRIKQGNGDPDNPLLKEAGPLHFRFGFTYFPFVK